MCLKTTDNKKMSKHTLRLHIRRIPTRTNNRPVLTAKIVHAPLSKTKKTKYPPLNWKKKSWQKRKEENEETERWEKLQFATNTWKRGFKKIKTGLKKKSMRLLLKSTWSQQKSTNGIGTRKEGWKNKDQKSNKNSSSDCIHTLEIFIYNMCSYTL